MLLSREGTRNDPATQALAGGDVVLAVRGVQVVPQRLQAPVHLAVARANELALRVGDREGQGQGVGVDGGGGGYGA